jgi:hypothetical protein
MSGQRDDAIRDSVRDVSVSYSLFGGADSLIASPQRLSTGAVVPPRFAARIDDSQMPYVVELEIVVADGQAHVRGVRVSARDGDPPVSTRSLRLVPITRYVEAALVAAELKIEEVEPGHYQVRRLHQAEGVAAAERAAATAARRRIRVTDPDEVRAEVARAGELHADALKDEDGRRRPTLYVAEHLHVSRAKAARLLKRFREGEGAD